MCAEVFEGCVSANRQRIVWGILSWRFYNVQCRTSRYTIIFRLILPCESSSVLHLPVCEI